jgi:hypothetical protein
MFRAVSWRKVPPKGATAPEDGGTREWQRAPSDGDRVGGQALLEALADLDPVALCQPDRYALQLRLPASEPRGSDGDPVAEAEAALESITDEAGARAAVLTGPWRTSVGNSVPHVSANCPHPAGPGWPGGYWRMVGRVTGASTRKAAE